MDGGRRVICWPGSLDSSGVVQRQMTAVPTESNVESLNVRLGSQSARQVETQVIGSQPPTTGNDEHSSDIRHGSQTYAQQLRKFIEVSLQEVVTTQTARTLGSWHGEHCQLLR